MASSIKQWQSIDPQMSTLKDIIGSLSTEQSKLEYYKYIHIMKLVKQFAIDNHLILYGGNAINELLPKTKKIYGPYDLPDYDLFSSTAKQDAINLGKYLKAHNIGYVEVKNGIHKGTFKVFAEFKSVADITQVNKNLYSYLLHESKNNPTETYSDPRIHVVPIIFIKWSFHRELASPESSMYRWEKIFERYLVFEKKYKWKPEKYELPTKTDDEEVHNILEQLNDIIKTMNYALTGPYAIHLHHSKKAEYVIDDYISSFEIMSMDLEKTKQDIVDYLNIPPKYKLKFVYRSSSPSHGDKFFIDLLPPRIRCILVNTENDKKYPVLTIVKVTNNCFSITKKNGYTFGTLDTILQLLYAYYMTYSYFMKGVERDITMKKISAQIQKCNQSLNSTVSTARFSSTCYGQTQSLIDIRKEMWNERPFRYRPGEQKTPRTGKSKSASSKKTKQHKT